MDLEQLGNSLNQLKDRLQNTSRLVWQVVLAIALAYMSATFVTSYIMSGMLNMALVTFNQKSGRPQNNQASINFNSNYNYYGVEKAVKDRNLFNSSGEFPEEKDPAAKSGDKKAGAFDINAPCAKPSVNVDLVGTIYLGEGGSVATLQEKGYSESDIYREGDPIIGNETASVAKIERNRVILNNGGIKECLELVVEGPKPKVDDFPKVASSAPPSGGVNTADGGSTAAGGGTDCALDEKYVQDELGPGFGTIIQKARLVPNTTDNQMNGFKIFAIDQGSLLGKTGLQNGDIITQVNETSLKQPEQGFALYQAFQDDKEVRIQILRRGTTPMTITCRIK